VKALAFCSIIVVRVHMNKPIKQNDDLESILESISQKILDHTLKTRKMDEFDFFDIAVWDLHDALEAAYAAGRKRR